MKGPPRSLSISRMSANHLPVFLEEDHHHVLEHILRAVGSKRLSAPCSDGVSNVLLHLDSHPDLLLPEGLTASDCSGRRGPDGHGGDIRTSLLPKLSIENWILPAVYLGVFDSVVWVCPPWCQQIRPGSYRFLVGPGGGGGGPLAVTCPEPYFLSEGIFDREVSAADSKELHLLVHRMGDTGDEEGLGLLVDFVKGKGALVLDVDLDFYSTKNPFLDLHPEVDLYSRLRRIYTFNPSPDDPEASCRTRKDLLRSLKIFTNLLSSPDFFSSDNDDDEVPVPAGANPEHSGLFGQLLQIGKDILRESQGRISNLAGIDWQLVHDAGCTCDDTELPHHVSTLEEIDRLLERTGELLTAIGVGPAMVTVARSSLDDFCPPDQVEYIQEKLLDLLRSHEVVTAGRGHRREIKEFLGYLDPA